MRIYGQKAAFFLDGTIFTMAVSNRLKSAIEWYIKCNGYIPYRFSRPYTQAEIDNYYNQ